MDPTIDESADTADAITTFFDNPLVRERERGPARNAARRTLERLLEERALRTRLQDDFHPHSPREHLDW